jgi:hypothetical protein
MNRAPVTILCLIVSLLAVMLVGIPVMAESGQDLAPISTPAPTPTRPISVRFEGIITKIAAELPGEWSVDDISFRVVTETEISPEGCTPQRGDYAIVSAIREGETLTAKRILIREKWFFEFRGVITELPPAPYDGEWLIGGVSVLVDSRATMITNVPVRNYYADVKGRLRPDRKVEATEIVVLNPQDIVNSFEFEGPIEQIPPTGEGLWVIAGVQGLVKYPDTRIEGAPTVGATAGVEGRRLADGTLFFERIRVLTEAQRQVRVTGLIEDIQEDLWLIRTNDGQTKEIIIEYTTFIDESRCRAAVGMWAEVIARRQGSLLIALRIRIERPD